MKSSVIPLSWLRLSLLQLHVGPNKAANLQRVAQLVQRAITAPTPLPGTRLQQANPAAVAATGGDSGDGGGGDRVHLVCLPECFNSPYGAKFFDAYAESVPDGETCLAMSQLAKQHKIWLVAGSMPERGSDKRLYNTCVTYNPDGGVVGVFRKLHLFDIDVPGQFTFRESDSLAPGNELFSFEIAPPQPQASAVATGCQGSRTDPIRVGVGICYDVRFPEMALVYARQFGCHLLLYPGAFSTTTGPAHWDLLGRARALDCQTFVGMCSPACDPSADYISHADSLVASPWGTLVAQAGKSEEVISVDIDLAEVQRVRSAIPTGNQRRLDVYTTPKSL